MNSIIKQTPLVSALASYCEDNSQNSNLKNFHLEIDVDSYNNLQNKYKKKIDEILVYQGKLIDYDQLKRFSKKKYIYFGNHMYEHYNVKVLNDYEIHKMYLQNIKELNKFKNFVNFFSFPNGIPNVSFSNNQIKYIIKNYNPNKISYSSRKINYKNNQILDRIAVSDNYFSIDYFEYIKLKTILKL